MDFRPQDLPEIRSEIRAQMAHPALLRPFGDKLGDTSKAKHEEWAGHLQEMVDELALFHVSEPMSELTFAAAQSLEVFTPKLEDMPAAGGLIVYNGRPGKVMEFDDGCTSPLRGIIWISTSSNWMLVIPVLECRPEFAMLGRLIAYPETLFTLDTEIDYERAWDGERLGQDDTLAILLTTWLLMQQQLADVSEVDPDRATRKRLRRIGQESAPIRVIELRRPKHTSSEPGESGRNYTHRWITRGHWRQQWYPARQVHRPVWIAPHVKGPEGAPMIGGEKVYAWKR